MHATNALVLKMAVLGEENQKMGVPSVERSYGAALVERLPFALSYAANLEYGDHAVLFYDNLVVAAEYICAYIEEAIQRNEPTCFIGLPRGLYERLFEQLGINVAGFENSGYLKHMAINDFSFEDGRFSDQKMLHSIEHFLELSKESGSKGARYILISGPFLDNIPQEKFLAFERSIKTCCCYYPISALCCHEARRAIINESKPNFVELLKAHNHCLFQGIGMATNLLVE